MDAVGEEASLLEQEDAKIVKEDGQQFLALATDFGGQFEKTVQKLACQRQRYIFSQCEKIAYISSQDRYSLFMLFSYVMVLMVNFRDLLKLYMGSILISFWRCTS